MPQYSISVEGSLGCKIVVLKSSSGAFARFLKSGYDAYMHKGKK